MTGVYPAQALSKPEFDAFIEEILRFNKNDPQNNRMVIESSSYNARFFKLLTKEQHPWYLRILCKIDPPENERAETIDRFVYDVFCKNKDHALADTVRSIEALAKLSAIVAPTLDSIKKYDALIQELMRARRENSQAELSAQKKAAEAEKTKNIGKARETSDAKVKQTREETQEKIKQGKVRAEETLEKSKNVREQLFFFASHDNKHDNVLLIAKDDKKITANFNLLSDPSYHQTIASHFGKVEISAEDKKAQPKLERGYLLSKYSEATLRAFILFLQQRDMELPAGLTFEMYQLAKETKNEKLIQWCLKCIVVGNSMTVDLALACLCQEDTSDDPLCQEACRFICKNIFVASGREDFKRIKHAQMLKIAKHSELNIDDEYQLYDTIKEWSGKTGKELKKILKHSINGETLLDCLRFEHFSKEQFVSVVTDKALTKSAIREGTSYLVAPSASEKTRINRGILTWASAGNSAKILFKVAPDFLSKDASTGPFKISFADVDVEMELVNKGNYWGETILIFRSNGNIAVTAKLIVNNKSTESIVPLKNSQFQISMANLFDQFSYPIRPDLPKPFQIEVVISKK